MTTFAANTNEQKLSRNQKRILNYFDVAGSFGYTSEELHKEYFLYQAESTSRTRISELVSLGLIKASDRKRSSRNGRMMTVWVIA